MENGRRNERAVSTVWVAVAVALAPVAARADAVVRVQADRTSNVYLDGSLAGSTPLTLSRMKAGSHIIKVESAETGELKSYSVLSPKNATAEKTIDVAWDTVAARPLPPPPSEPYRSTEVVRTTVYAPPPPPPDHYPPPGEVYAPEYGPHNDDYYYRAERSREERDKVRSRNVLLGSAAANEIFNRGRSKKTVRAVTLGGALLNEVLRSGK
jgi:hypothetical protein